VGAYSDAGAFPKRACPVCGSEEQDLIYRQVFERFTSGSIGDGYDVVACGVCGACVASRLPGQARFDEYYGAASKYDLGATDGQLCAHDAARFACLAEWVSAQVADRSRPVLDVGTATGGFLTALGGQGFSSLCGVDPSAHAVRLAREQHGLDVKVGGIDEAQTWGSRFHLICFCAVLEHLLHPRATIRAAAELLDEDGMILIEVPDAARFQDCISAPYQEFSVEHINYFTDGSLRYLMAAAGLAPLAQRRSTWAQSADAKAPILDAVFVRAAGAVGAVTADAQGPRALADYARRSSEKDAAVAQKIQALADVGRPLYVWGVGTHTLHLLKCSALGECNITAFIDGNPHYSGATLAGRPVLAPGELQTVDSPILISSAVSQSEIAAAARDLYGASVELILLY
jgi:SAM-dependent methyltransferase